MRISDWSSYVCSSDLSRIGPGHVFDPAGTEQWDDMAFDPSEVGVDGRRPFRPPALAENEPRFEIGPVKVAQLFDGQRLVTELLFFCRIVTASNPSSEERAGGKEGVSTLRYRWWPSYKKKKI